MPHPLHTTLCALLLTLPAIALAQDEAPAEEPAVEETMPVEEMPAEGIPVDEAAAPAEEGAVPAEEAAAPAEEAAPTEEAAAPVDETIPVEEGEAAAGETAKARSQLDLFMTVKANVDFSVPGVGSADDDGDGYGVRALFVAGEHSVVTAEYQTASYDDSGLDLDQIRLAMGVTMENSTTGAYVAFNQLDLEDETADGLSLHGRYAMPVGPVEVYGTLGYFWLDDSAEQLWGPEVSAGAAFAFGNFGVFADYRMTMLEGQDSSVEIELTDIRAGGRFYF